MAKPSSADTGWRPSELAQRSRENIWRLDDQCSWGFSLSRRFDLRFTSRILGPQSNILIGEVEATYISQEPKLVGTFFLSSWACLTKQRKDKGEGSLVVGGKQGPKEGSAGHYI